MEAPHSGQQAAARTIAVPFLVTVAIADAGQKIRRAAYESIGYCRQRKKPWGTPLTVTSGGGRGGRGLVLNSPPIPVSAAHKASQFLENAAAFPTRLAPRPHDPTN